MWSSHTVGRNHTTPHWSIFLAFGQPCHPVINGGIEGSNYPLFPTPRWFLPPLGPPTTFWPHPKWFKKTTKQSKLWWNQSTPGSLKCSPPSGSWGIHCKTERARSSIVCSQWHGGECFGSRPQSVASRPCLASGSGHALSKRQLQETDQGCWLWHELQLRDLHFILSTPPLASSLWTIRSSRCNGCACFLER